MPRVCVCPYILIEPFIHSRRAAKLRVGRACWPGRGGKELGGHQHKHTHTAASLQQSFLYKQQITSSREWERVFASAAIFTA